MTNPVIGTPWQKLDRPVSEEAIEGMEPSVITRYILELCGAFNRYCGFRKYYCLQYGYV